MQTISINCTGRTLRNVKKQIRNLFHLQKRKSGRDLYCSRCVNFYLDMLGTSNGDNFSYISLERLAHDNQCEIVTARRGVKRLTAGGWVVPGVKYIPGKGFMKGFFLLAHRLIVRLLQGIAGLVLRFHDDGPETVETEQVVDNLSSSLTIRTELTVKNPPPTPPQAGGSAGAEKEMHYEQQSEAKNPAPLCQPGDFADHRRYVGSHGLRIDRGTATQDHADGLRSEPETIQQVAIPGQTEEADAAESDGLTPEVWQAALALLLQQMSEEDFNLWIRPINACQTSNGLQLDCPDQLFAAYVQQHFGSIIQNVLQKTGIKQFSFSSGFQQMEQQNQQELEKKNELCRQYQELASKPLEEQFAVLHAAYPRKSGGTWFAWRTFRRLSRRGELPDIRQLMQLLQRQLASDDWQRDAGRWIPGLHKWLRNKPWWHCGKAGPSFTAGEAWNRNVS